jgi:hypothetical protein
MNFGEATDAIVSLIKRRDKEAAVKGHINRAISFYVAFGTFAHDMVELPTFAIDGTLYAQSFAINASPFTRFRKLKYIRPASYLDYLHWKDPATIFTGTCEQVDCWYRSGVNIVFKLSMLQPTVALGYYQYHAALVNPADTDWMLDEMWSAVHDMAASYAFGDIGNVDESKRYYAWGMDHYRIALRDIGDGVSHG